MIQIAEKAQCCGCGACKNICQTNCIQMNYDNEGFLYPITEKKLCIECGQCESICPILNPVKEVPFMQEGYIVQHRSKIILRESTSGGGFTAIADYVLKCGGVVYGAAFETDLSVSHQFVRSRNELWKFRNSKYVQSDTKDTFLQVKEDLKKGLMVCYSGTPCQIEGLKSFLGKEYDMLITVDVVCHAVPSPLVWQKYLEMQETILNKKISNVSFRDKFYGYQYSQMVLKGIDNEMLYHEGVESDQMFRAFFSNICVRPSCYECKFKKRYRVSDFTIWDCFKPYDFDKKIDSHNGTTNLLIHTIKGRKIFEDIKNEIDYFPVESDYLTRAVKEMFESVGMNPKRKAFFEDVQKMQGEVLFDKYFPITFWTKVEKHMRRLLFKAGIYTQTRRLFNNVKKIIK